MIISNYKKCLYIKRHMLEVSPMKQTIQLTEREEEVMNFMWEYGKPVTSNDILALCTNRTWKDSYLQIMLRSLKKKGAIKECGRILYNTQYAYLLKPTLSKEEYYLQLAYKRGVNRRSFIQLAVSIANDMEPEETDSLIDSLSKLIEELDQSKKD